MRKWLKYEYLAGLIYLGLAIFNGIQGEYQQMAAYIVVVIFVFIVYLKDLTIDSKDEIIDSYKKLTNNMLEYIQENQVVISEIKDRLKKHYN